MLSFVDGLDERVAQIAGRGIEPAKRETYEGGVTKVIYRDADGDGMRPRRRRRGVTDTISPVLEGL